MFCLLEPLFKYSGQTFLTRPSSQFCYTNNKVTTNFTVSLNKPQVANGGSGGCFPSSSFGEPVGRWGRNELKRPQLSLWNATCFPNSHRNLNYKIKQRRKLYYFFSSWAVQFQNGFKLAHMHSLIGLKAYCQCISEILCCQRSRFLERRVCHLSSLSAPDGIGRRWRGRRVAVEGEVVKVGQHKTCKIQES